MDGAARINPRQDDDSGAGAGAATLLRLTAAATYGRERMLSARRCRHGSPAPSSGGAARSAVRRTADDTAAVSVRRRSDRARSGPARRARGARMQHAGRLLAADLDDGVQRTRGRHRHHHRVHRLLLAAGESSSGPFSVSPPRADRNVESETVI